MTEKICKLCGNPFETYVELGPDKFPVWIHDYPTLETCKAFMSPQDFVKQIELKNKIMSEIMKKAIAEGGQKLWITQMK